MKDVLLGKGSLVMLAGEAGIGKTWLAQTFAEECRQANIVVMQGGCFEGDWRPAYGPWVEAITNYVSTCSSETLSRQLGDSALTLSPFAQKIREILPETAILPSLSRDEERFRLYDAVVQFLLAISHEQPVLLVFDDLHWADGDSLRLLRHVARSIQRGRLIIVGVYNDTELELERRHPLADTLTALRRELDYQQISLQGLELPEVVEYLAEVAEQPLPLAVVKAIYSSTNGNPFYVREVFRHLAEEGKILQRSGRWSTDLSIRELGIPSGVRQLLLTRITRLAEETGVLLGLASGFTGGFTYPLLQNLSQFSEDVLLNSLDEALRARLIRVEEGLPSRYDFPHAIVRQTLYQEMNPERRARLHQRIALTMEQVYAGRQMEHAGELAYQYLASASLQKTEAATLYALAAAEQARKALAFDQTVGFLRMAMDLSAAMKLGERADIVRRLAVGEAEALLLDAAAETTRIAVTAMAEAGLPAYEQAEFLATMTRLIKDGGANVRTWEPLLESGLALLGDERSISWAKLKLLSERIEPVSTGLINGSFQQDHDPEAVAIARAQGSEDDYATTLEVFAYRTRAETEQVLKLTRTWHSSTAVARALDIVARDMLYCHGMFKEAAELYQNLVTVGEQFGSILWQAESLAQLALGQAALGDLAGARNTVAAASNLIVRLGEAHGLHFIEVGLGSLIAYFVGGDWPDLAVKAEQFAISSAAARNPSGLCAGALAAFAHCRAGNITQSRRFLTALGDVMTRVQPTLYGNNLSVAMAASAVWELKAREFASLYRQLAFDLINVGVGPSFAASHELIVARMAALLGQNAEAAEYFQRARAAFLQQGMFHFCAITDFDEASALSRTDDYDRERVLVLLEGARQSFSELEMQPWAIRALELREFLTAQSGRPRRRREAHSVRLTRREEGVLALLAGGKTNKEIAAQLVVSVATAERHIANIYDKIGVRSRSEAVAYALRHGLVQM